MEAATTTQPLVIRGARQVGKTTLVQQFATAFPQYLYLNLELPADRQCFQQFTDIDTLLQAPCRRRLLTTSHRHLKTGQHD